MSAPTYTARDLHAAIIRRDKLARQLAELDKAITEAGRVWSRERGIISPLRFEQLRHEVSANL